MGGYSSRNRGTVLAYFRGMVATTAALLLSALAGCLLPPPIEEVAAPENQPPRILPESLSPSPWRDGPRTLSTDCNTYQFTVTITDADPGTTLHWRAFLDYHNDPRPRDAVSGQETPNQKPVTITFPVDPKDHRFGVGNAHLVELLVSDGPFAEDDRDPPGRAVDAEVLTDSVTWTVLLDDKPCGQL